MPSVVNGIGTWYYGKQRIHRVKSTCGFCNRVGELESYDTTLYIVVFFVPLVPLSRKRVLESCPSCQKHRAAPLKKWEESKALAIAQMMERVEQDPDNRENIQNAIGLAVGYQDEVLFDKLAPALAGNRQDDVAIQSQLAAAYGYFSRWEEAENAWRTVVAKEDTPSNREQLALSLLKQGRPDAAAPLISHILDHKLKEDAGMIYVLIESYQAQGMHAEALELINQRDQSFPDMATLKDYKKQRKISEKHQHTGKKIKSAFLDESTKVGYREGNWTSKLPKLIGPLVALGLLCWYLGAAVWIGQSRKVHLVNGWTQPYTVLLNGKPQNVRLGVTEIHVPEGELVLEGADDTLPLEPTRIRLETPFFSRPFKSPTFILNPDQIALLVEQETVYAEAPAGPDKPPKLHFGQVLTTLHGLDYVFQEFPATLQLKEGSKVTKTRVTLGPNLGSMTRVGLAIRQLDPSQQLAYAKALLRAEPDNPLFVGWMMAQLKDEEALNFLKTGLDVRPLRLEWHRGYQHFMDKLHREVDLRPEYRRLVAELKDLPDALYLLGRVEDLDTAGKLFKRAATGHPTSIRAQFALGAQAAAEARFDDAVSWMAKASTLAKDQPRVKRDYRDALLAAKQFDPLLAELQHDRQLPEAQLGAMTEQVRVWAAKGDRGKAKALLDEATESLKQPDQQPLQQPVRETMEAILCCCDNDVAGFLKHVRQVTDSLSVEGLLLEGRVADAAAHADLKQGEDAEAKLGLVYLYALRNGNAQLADEQLKRLQSTLEREDRYTRQFASMLSGGRPVEPALVRRLPVNPRQKRVLVAVLARRFPDHAKELIPFARQLNFHRDATGLCLNQVIEK